METSIPTTVERILIITCCFIIASAVTTPAENLGLNSGNTVQVPRFHYPSEDSSKADPWNYNYPMFSIPLQEASPETKRRSSFFPVRGKKVSENLHLLAGSPNRFHDAASKSRSDVQLENESDSLPLKDYLNWPQEQKRPSSFMPMRGRKRYMDRDNLQVLKGYLSSRAHDDILGHAYEDMFFDGDLDKGMKEIDRYGNDYPDFLGKIEKDEADRDQIEKHFRFLSNQRPLHIKNTKNGGTALNPKSFSSENIIQAKRALSFVPTRGRREKQDEFESEFLSRMTGSHPIAKWSEYFPAGHAATNFSRYALEPDDKIDQRYRRASAFMPMRGRKSAGNPYWLAYKYLPQRFGDDERRNSIEYVEQQSSETDEMRRQNLDGIGVQRQKKSFDGSGLQSPLTQQKLRTALVMKRPLSFFAARGKRLDANRISAL